MEKNNTTTYQVISEIEKFEPDGITSSHEYDIVIEKVDNLTITSLVRSNDLTWNDSVKGEVVLKFIDDGDGISIRFPKKGNYFDYAQIVELHILLSFLNKNKEYFSGKIVESKIIQTI